MFQTLSYAGWVDAVEVSLEEVSFEEVSSLEVSSLEASSLSTSSAEESPLTVSSLEVSSLEASSLEVTSLDSSSETTSFGSSGENLTAVMMLPEAVFSRMYYIVLSGIGSSSCLKMSEAMLIGDR